MKLINTVFIIFFAGYQKIIFYKNNKIPKKSSKKKLKKLSLTSLKFINESCAMILKKFFITIFNISKYFGFILLKLNIKPGDESIVYKCQLYLKAHITTKVNNKYLRFFFMVKCICLKKLDFVVFTLI